MLGWRLFLLSLWPADWRKKPVNSTWLHLYDCILHVFHVCIFDWSSFLWPSLCFWNWCATHAFFLYIPSKCTVCNGTKLRLGNCELACGIFIEPLTPSINLGLKAEMNVLHYWLEKHTTEQFSSKSNASTFGTKIFCLWEISGFQEHHRTGFWFCRETFLRSFWMTPRFAGY